MEINSKAILVVDAVNCCAGCELHYYEPAAGMWRCFADRRLLRTDGQTWPKERPDTCMLIYADDALVERVAKVLAKTFREHHFTPRPAARAATMAMIGVPNERT